MVEGPGCKVKGEKMKGRLQGKVLNGVTVSGNVVEKKNKAKKNPDAVNQYYQLIGRKLDDVQTLGKELFMYFGDKCLRVHFLMDGSYRVSNQVLDHDPSNQNSEVMLLEIGEDKVAFYKCSVDIRLSADCRAKFDRLHSLDICSSTFNHKRAVQLFMEKEYRLVCDVLLDQVILPGVGNIIKNEALFDSGIRPSSRVKELSEELVSHLIRMTRDFSMIFYKCRKMGESLRKYEKVYNKRACCQCRGKITVTRMGEDSARMTYYCPNCQTNDPKDARTLPTKNSLLGWVTSGQNQPMSTEWTCTACTLINESSARVCFACEGKKPNVEPKAIQVPILKPVQTILNSQDNTSSSRRTSNRTIKSNKRKGEPIPYSPTKRLKSDVGFYDPKSAGSGAPSSKRVFLGNSLPTVKSDSVMKGHESAIIDLTDSDIVGLGGGGLVTTTRPGKTGAVNVYINAKGSNISPTNGGSTLVNSKGIVNINSKESSSEQSKLNRTGNSKVTSDLKLNIKSNSQSNVNITGTNSNVKWNFSGSNSSLNSGTGSMTRNSSVNSSASSVNVKTNSFQPAQSNSHGNSTASAISVNVKFLGGKTYLGRSSAASGSGGSNKVDVARTATSDIGGNYTSLKSTNSSSSVDTNRRPQLDPGMSSSKIPLCPKHNRKCALREVRKEGPTLGKMFFCCSLPRGKQCFIFRWADDEFPICEGHGQTCVLRTVLKEGSNNGRKFFACSLDRKKQCKFFQWADEYND